MQSAKWKCYVHPSWTEVYIGRFFTFIYNKLFLVVYLIWTVANVKLKYEYIEKVKRINLQIMSYIQLYGLFIVFEQTVLLQLIRTHRTFKIRSGLS